MLDLAPYVALRYLKSTRRDAFISFLSVTAAAGIALGVAALILALAALSGFQQALRQEIVARTPEIEIELPPGADPGEAKLAVEAVSGAGTSQLMIRGRGWLAASGRLRPAELVGYEGDLPASFPGAASSAKGLYVGDRLASIWGLTPGDVVEVGSARPSLTPLGPQPRVRRLTLAGTFATGRTEQEERAALPLEEAEILLGVGDYRLLVATGGLDRAVELAPRLEEVLPAGSSVRTWQYLNRALFFALRLEKGVMFIAVFLIVVVAALALVSDLSLIIAAKRAEIGMLGAMGTSGGRLRAIFLWLGGFLAGIGTLLGLLVGVGGSWALDRFRVLRLPSRVYFLDYVPFRVESLDLATVLVATLGLSLLCSLWAAGRAAGLRPVEALRR